MNRNFSKLLAIIVLVFFSWTFAGVFQVAYAIDNLPQTSNNTHSSRTPKSEERFQKAIEEIGEILEDPVTDRETKASKVKAKKGEIEELDKEIRKQFAETEKKLREARLPDEILQRHHKFVKHYEDNLNELKANLDSIEKTKGLAVEVEIEKAKKHLQRVKPPKKHIPLDPNKLPHRTPKIEKREPRIKKEDFERDFPNPKKAQGQKKHILVASIGSLKGLLSENTEYGTEYSNSPNLIVAQATNQPSPEDLAENIEVQFTPEIRAKAQELGYNPVKIYNWVRNNIEFVPTYGSIQGAHMTLLTKHGNAFDTASLLIALLRASNIPARYVYGTIELPIDKVMNWVGGFTDANAALDFIASGGIPVAGIISGGKVVKARLEHCWVEAYVPYGNYRGTMIDQTIKTWIPMDGSFKQYEYTTGLNVAKNVTFDKSSYLSRFNDITPIGFYLDQIQTYLETNYPGTTIDDIKRAKVIKIEERELLSSTLPHKTLAKLATLSVLSDIFRYKVGITIPDIIDNSLEYQAGISEIMGKRLTISYVPSTVGDEQLINQYGGFYKVPAYLLRVKPAIKIEGNIVASGSEIPVGTEQEMNVDIIYPSSGMDRITHNIKAGGYYALGLYQIGSWWDLYEQRFEKYINEDWGAYPDPYNDALGGELLNMIVLSYFLNMETNISNLLLVSNYAYSQNISEVLSVKNIDVSYFYGVPYTIQFSTKSIDIKRGTFAIKPIDGDNGKNREIVDLLGLTSSALEHQTLEENTSKESISAVKSIQLANDIGIPIHRIDQSNVTQELPRLSVSEEIKISILDAVNQGKVVTIPQTNFQYNLWYGVGWIVEDPLTGAGAYQISGFLMGGETTQDRACPCDSVSMNNATLDSTCGPSSNPSCTELGNYLADDIYKAIAYQESKWSQFNSEGEPLTHENKNKKGVVTSIDVGTMQINSSWKNLKWPIKLPDGTQPTIDWKKVQCDWKYNIDLGKAIFEYDISQAMNDLKNADIADPTEEQTRLAILSRYNSWKPYYVKNKDGKAERNALNPDGCYYADKVNEIFKTKTWTNSKSLKCAK